VLPISADVFSHASAIIAAMHVGSVGKFQANTAERERGDIGRKVYVGKKGTGVTG
jgi:hypothetical protein